MKQRKQRGSGWSIAFVLKCYKILGYQFIYYLQYPISFFYFLKANNVKDALKAYYIQIGVPYKPYFYFEHLRIFAICLVDRFISKIEPKSYTFEYDDTSVPREILSQGSILIYSHFGGWAASSNNAPIKNQLNIVSQESMMSDIKSLENALDIPSNVKIIDLNKGMLEVSIKVANALLNEEVVVMMADRASNKKAELSIPFFGKEAKFNKNPFQVAYKMNKPLLVYFIIWKGKKHYKVEYLVIKLNKKEKEKIAIKEAMIQYVTKYEEVIKAHPQQWFNLYDFWEK